MARRQKKIAQEHLDAAEVVYETAPTPFFGFRLRPDAVTVSADPGVFTRLTYLGEPVTPA